MQLYKDTSVVMLKAVVENRAKPFDDYNSDLLNEIYKKNSIQLLSYYHPEEKEFIITVLDSLVSKDKREYGFFSAEIKGFLGVAGATDEMKEYAKSSNDNEKYMAIYYLAYIEDFSYLEDLLNALDKGNHYVNNMISIYASIPANKSIITNKLETIIDTLTYEWNKVELLNILLATNKEIGIIKCREMIYSINNDYKFHIMGLINRYAFDQLPNITIEYFNNTNGQIEFDMFLPSVRGINYGWHSIKYLQPSFINCIKINKNRLADENNRYDVNELLALFKPFKPDSTHSLQYLMDDLQNYLEEVNNYGWLNESAKYAEYKTQLEYAETNIANNEFEECRIKLEEFKNGIQNDFNNGLITNEAYRYLFFYPDYLIERLPNGVLSVPR
ncbi:MAG: hypothetical protein GXX85_13280 [Ignavibacteria bacterium]|nr:hypothetical protein [Ignavibacteria bacterium]